MEDLISRRAAIDAVKQREWLTEDAKEILEEVLTQLPTTQPETCEGCKHVDKVEYKYISPCSCCKRRVPDYYTQ